MTSGDTIKVDGLGTLLVHSVSGDYVRGTWQSGPLKGKKAGCSRRALLGQDVAVDPAPRKVTRGRAAALREELRTALEAGPVDISAWAQVIEVEESTARGVVGALRSAGYTVRSLGGGKFGF